MLATQGGVGLVPCRGLGDLEPAWEDDTDALMRRTRDRPSRPAGQPTIAAYTFAVALAYGGVWMVAEVNTRHDAL